MPTKEELDVVVSRHLWRNLIENPLQLNKTRAAMAEALQVLSGLHHSSMVKMEAYEGDEKALGSQILGELKQGMSVANSGV
ncbi:hypothetical protein SUGI_0004030 [Cryptomeria japonica]|nr:hypothetical protein SUGI_0004030 [Cryptomeria japonica]